MAIGERSPLFGRRHMDFNPLTGNKCPGREEEKMKTIPFFTLLALVLMASLLTGGSAFAGHHPPAVRTMDPIVNTGWLNANSGLANLVILDIRSTDAYAAGHIPGAINAPFVVPFSAWITMRDDLLLEVPDETDLFNTIGSLGIGSDSWVVIVTAPNPGEPPFYGLANATRVADTLIYAGIVNVAVLDGGYPQWVEDGGATTVEVPDVIPRTYTGKINEAMFVSIDYVHRHARSADILDARDAEVYFGVAIEPFAEKAGHIPTALSLPTPWIWNHNSDEIYTYKDPDTLRAMVSGVIGRSQGHRGHGIIVYCGVGGYASSWWFVLTQVLGYENVKFYDGSAQEWVRYYDMVPYQWE